MNLYLLFLLFAFATVLSPGPGVVMTLTNALRYGFRGTFGGILGISADALAVAAISATSLGALLAASATAFSVMKIVGAAYLIFLGLRLWRAAPPRLDERGAHAASFLRRFAEGLTLQLTNPKAIFFFLSVFPQFIDPSNGYFGQFALLVATYAALVVVVHSFYAVFAARAKRWLASDFGGRLFNRISGTAFILFGCSLAVAKRA